MAEKLRFSGQLGTEDMARHVLHSFPVPLGIGTLKIVFVYSPHHPSSGPIANQLSISLYGPNGARGTRHNCTDQSPIISTAYATPGYLPGPIERGEWTVAVDVHRVLPPDVVTYEIMVVLEEQPVPAIVMPQPTIVEKRGPGWYRGDIHGHSDHSDGRWSVKDFIAHAREAGLDFVTLTDHNTISGHAEALSLAGNDLLVLTGMELTTFFGHALVLGPSRWADWRITGSQTMAQRVRILEEQGHTFVIAHPMHIGHPWCTGCHWAYSDVFPGPSRLVEIWNSNWKADDGYNEAALKLFRSWLNQGIMMRATAGTDIHGPPSSGAMMGYNCVWAETLSADAILSSIKAGRNVLTCGPKLEMVARSAVDHVMIGGLLNATAAQIDLLWEDVPEGSRLHLLEGAIGMEETTLAAEIIPEPSGCATVTIETVAKGTWLMAELRDAEAQMLAVTNPIFFAGDWR